VQNANKCVNKLGMEIIACRSNVPKNSLKDFFRIPKPFSRIEHPHLGFKFKN
jgi:hypothetical protein